MCDYPGETDASGQVNIVEKIVFPTKKGPEASLTAIYSSTEELLHKNGLQPSQIAGIGISAGGRSTAATALYFHRRTCRDGTTCRLSK